MKEVFSMKKNQKNKSEDLQDLDLENSVISSTECTGLTYIPPENSEEADSYTEIYKVPVTAKKKNKKK